MSLMQYAAESDDQLAPLADSFSDRCEAFCSADGSQCSWKACKGCSLCQPAGCKSFCSEESQCGWKACKGCSFCQQQATQAAGCKSFCSKASQCGWKNCK